MKLKYLSVASFLFATMIAAHPTSASSHYIIASEFSAPSRTSPLIYSRSEVNTMLKYILENMTGIPNDAISNDALLMKDLGLDSLDMLDLVEQCKECFEINFSSSDALTYSRIYTVDSFTDVIYHFCQSDDDYIG